MLRPWAPAYAECRRESGDCPRICYGCCFGVLLRAISHRCSVSPSLPISPPCPCPWTWTWTCVPPCAASSWHDAAPHPRQRRYCNCAHLASCASFPMISSCPSCPSFFFLCFTFASCLSFFLAAPALLLPLSSLTMTAAADGSIMHGLLFGFWGLDGCQPSKLSLCLQHLQLYFTFWKVCPSTKKMHAGSVGKNGRAASFLDVRNFFR